jgi:hypothetical protein
MRNQSYQTYAFPNIPKNWNEDDKQFAHGLRQLFDRLFGRMVTQRDIDNAVKDKVTLSDAYPVGIVVLSDDGNAAPFEFGEWTAVTSGITGVYGWKRTE